MTLVDAPISTVGQTPLGQQLPLNDLLLPVQALSTGFVIESRVANLSATLRQEADNSRDVVVPNVPLAMPALTGAARADAASLQNFAANHAGASCQGVRIGSVALLLAYEDSSELTELPDLYYLPNAPEWMLGLVNLHGSFVPVFDLAAYLGMGRAQITVQEQVENKPMLLVLGHGADAAGVVIDGLPERLNPLERQRTDIDTAPLLLQPHLKSAYFIEEQLWFDLNCASLLDSLEQAMMV